MKHTVLILCSTAFLASGAANAASSPKEERVGVGVGVTLGAVAGGPVGALLGAAIGAKLGDSYHRKNETIAALGSDLEQSSARVATLESRIKDMHTDMSVLDSDLRRLQAQARPELVSLLQAGIEMDLLFRTDEHVLRDATQSRLSQLAATLAAMPDVRVQLDGYADARGDDEYNRELSERRAQSVQALLVANGVPQERITVNAHGEAPVNDTTPDSFALDRKVSLTLYLENSPSLAANPN